MEMFNRRVLVHDLLDLLGKNLSRAAHSLHLFFFYQFLKRRIFFFSQVESNKNTWINISSSCLSDCNSFACSLSTY